MDDSTGKLFLEIHLKSYSTEESPLSHPSVGVGDVTSNSRRMTPPLSSSLSNSVNGVRRVVPSLSGTWVTGVRYEEGTGVSADVG